MPTCILFMGIFFVGGVLFGESVNILGLEGFWVLGLDYEDIIWVWFLGLLRVYPRIPLPTLPTCTLG